MIAGAVEFYIDQQRLAPACFVLFLGAEALQLGSIQFHLSRLSAASGSKHLAITCLSSCYSALLFHTGLFSLKTGYCFGLVTLRFGGRGASAELCVNSMLGEIPSQLLTKRVLHLEFFSLFWGGGPSVWGPSSFN